MKNYRTKTWRPKRKPHEVAKKRKPKVADLPAHLRGYSSNKHGGQQLQTMKGFKGSTYGPAGECKSLSKEEIAAENDRYVAMMNQLKSPDPVI